MNNRVLGQLLLGALCIAGPFLAKDYLLRFPAATSIFGTVLGLTPIILPSRPRVRRRDIDRELEEAAAKEGLTPEQVELLRRMLYERVRRPALRFRILAAAVLYLVICALFAAMVLVARIMGIAHPPLLWWTAGFLWGLLGSVVWTALWGGRYVPAPTTSE